MKITKIKIKNFRLLKNFSLDLEDNLSLIIGKNNTGKTSFLNILQKFFNSTKSLKSFNFEDFSLDIQKQIGDKIIEPKNIPEENYIPFNLQLKISIEYENTNEENLKNLSKFILDLDPKKKEVLLSFEYLLDFKNFRKLQLDFKNFRKLQNDPLENTSLQTLDFLRKNHTSYFDINIKSIDVNDEKNFRKIENLEDVKKIINIKSISAKRGVVDEDRDSLNDKKTLSKQASKYFNLTENSQEQQFTDLQKVLIQTDTKLTNNYESIFGEITDGIKKFSYDNSNVSIKSNLQSINLLKGNTSVVYDEKNIELPEDYNGLGYLNLFSIIFELHIIFKKFKKTYQKRHSEEPADINLLFIEEPEAHTHPQMQYVFIKNIKNFLNENKESLNLQTIISTHSSHIISQSDFDYIKYFLNKNEEVFVKNLSELKGQYKQQKQQKNYNFLKKYLTLTKAELFFSDKIILIEGATERILLPVIMEKLDLENKNKSGYKPLLSQNISVVEITASHSFTPFINFLEIKTLIITDIDGGYKKSKSSVQDATYTSNKSINYFLPNQDFQNLKNIPDTKRIIEEDNVQLYLAFQNKEKDYHGSSFEDAFISLNIEFIKNNKNEFDSLKNKELLDENPPDYYKIAEDCITKKTDFVIDIIHNSKEDFSNWEIPDYIKKGLLWIGK